MAQKPLDQFAIEFITKGSRQAMRDMQSVVDKMKEMQNFLDGDTSALKKDTEEQKRNSAARMKNEQAVKKQSSALWTFGKRLVSVYALYKLFQKGIGLAVNFAEKGNALANMSTISGASTQGIQKWGYALRRFGGNEKTIANTLGTLKAKLIEFKKYGNNSVFEDFMTKAGGTVTGGTDPEQFLKSVARQMEGRSTDEKRYMAQTLGLDPATTAFLMQGAKAVEAQLKNAQALYSPEDIKKAQAAKDNLVEFNRELEKLGVTVGRVLLPYLTEFTKWMGEFIENPEKAARKLLGEKDYSRLEKVGGLAYELLHPNEEGKMKAATDAVRMFTDPVGYFMGDSIEAARKAQIEPFSSGLPHNLLGKSSLYSNSETNLVINGVDVQNASEVAKAARQGVEKGTRPLYLMIQDFVEEQQ